ncbi:MAG: cytidine deaminase [Eubacterium sp.]|nr:cytidine deaminase [Eubacterium sp.]
MGEITDVYKVLFRKALRVSENAYSPYSGIAVGAALMTVHGKIFTGVNVENSSYGAGICAERTACVKAVSEGETEFKAIAVASPEGKMSPCGICRQFLYEFSPDMDVITGEDADHLECVRLSGLLPDGFRLEK